MFDQLKEINRRPALYEHYTAADLWTDEHTSSRMLEYHLNGDIDVSSRNADFICRSTSWIIERFDLASGGKVIDFGCGPGLYTIPLAEMGARVTGVDFSVRSLDHAGKTARDKGLEVEFLHRNYLEFETGERFDLAMMIMCDFCALNPEQRMNMLRRFHGLLKSRGHVLLDVYSPRAFAKAQETAEYAPNQLDGFWSAGEYYGFLNRFKYMEEHVLLDKYTIVEAARTRTMYNWLRHFRPEDLKLEFQDAGFEVEEVLGDVAGGNYSQEHDEFAVIARRK